MKFLDRFERLVERGVEGGLSRVLPRTLQPVQIAKAAARAMDDGRVVGVRGLEAPNLYHVRLAPADLARFGDYRATLATNTASYLVEYARQRGLRLAASPWVELVDDRRVPLGSVRVDARFRDLAPSPAAGPPPSVGSSAAGLRASVSQPGASSSPHSNVPPSLLAPEAGVVGQAPLGSHDSPVPAPAPNPAAREDTSSPVGASDRAWLVDHTGQRFALDPAHPRVRLGRTGDNDVVLDADTVSRHHAELRWRADQWFVSDLGSTNGTTLAGVPVTAEPVALRAGATLRLGDRALTFVIH